MRGKIALALSQYNFSGQVCSHKRKDYVAGVFGGIELPIEWGADVVNNSKQ